MTTGSPVRGGVSGYANLRPLSLKQECIRLSPSSLIKEESASLRAVSQRKTPGVNHTLRINLVFTDFGVCDTEKKE